MNYADEQFNYTRIHEPRHLHPERNYTKKRSIIIFETPKPVIINKTSLEDSDEPYYPINTENNRILYKKYYHLAQKEKDLVIGGRLGEYTYCDMDKTILNALKCYEINIRKNK